MASRDNETTRREVLAGISVGIAALSAGAAAQTKAGGTEPGASRPAVPNYPRPPFPAQQQEWPGLAGRMDPRPDHGEASYRGSGKLAGRKALITGGDSGMGRAVAIAFAREGADVAFNYLPQEEPDSQEVVKFIKDAGRKAVPLPGDLRNEDFCKKLVSDAVGELGGLDILVNNAARQHALREISQLTTELLDWTLKTNIYAMVWLTRAALEHMGPGASIVNTTSVVAYDPPENLVDYAMTKAAVMNFTKSMAKQLAPRQIRVNAWHRGRCGRRSNRVAARIPRGCRSSGLTRRWGGRDNPPSSHLYMCWPRPARRPIRPGRSSAVWAGRAGRDPRHARPSIYLTTASDYCACEVRSGTG